MAITAAGEGVGVGVGVGSGLVSVSGLVETVVTVGGTAVVGGVADDAVVGVADDAVVGVVVAVGGGAVVGAGTGWLASSRTSWSTSSCCSAVRSIGCFALWLVVENELGTALRTLTTHSTTYSEKARCDWPAMGEFFRGWWGQRGGVWHHNVIN